MKTYIFTYKQNRSDINGNSRHWIKCLYRLKNNRPIRLNDDMVEIGYSDKEATVINYLIKIGELPKKCRSLMKCEVRKMYNINIIEV